MLNCTKLQPSVFGFSTKINSYMKEIAIIKMLLKYKKYKTNKKTWKLEDAAWLISNRSMTK